MRDVTKIHHLSVRLLVRDDATNTSTRVFCISVPARDQVNVAVKDRLTGGFPCVRSNVETTDGLVFGEELFLDILQ